VIALAAAVLMLIVGCETTEDADPYVFETAPLYGMVYGYDKQPVSSAVIYVDGEAGPTTDLEGRFIVPNLARGDHTIRIVKAGYEESSAMLSFLNLTQVFYARLHSAADLIQMCEAALLSGDYFTARQSVDRALQLSRDNIEARYLDAVVLLYQGRAEEAAERLRVMVQDGVQIPDVYLTLADICQYELDLPEDAADYLRTYLSMQRDPEVELRLRELAPANP
jgi:hypothetical protein